MDFHRRLRQGVAEVIYGEGKTAEQITGIVSAMKAKEQPLVLITRLKPETAEAVSRVHELAYHQDAGVGIVGSLPKPDGNGNIVVATGGTSDIPVAEEAALTAEALGNRVERLYDVGVAGLHRLLSHMETIMNANVIICIAGMEGALPSVVGGLADCPVIAVPTSVGYGAFVHAEFLCQRHLRRQYRQRVLRRLSGQHDQSSGMPEKQDGRRMNDAVASSIEANAV